MLTLVFNDGSEYAPTLEEISESEILRNFTELSSLSQSECEREEKIKFSVPYDTSPFLLSESKSKISEVSQKILINKINLWNFLLNRRRVITSVIDLLEVVVASSEMKIFSTLCFAQTIFSNFYDIYFVNHIFEISQIYSIIKDDYSSSINEEKISFFNEYFLFPYVEDEESRGRGGSEEESFSLRVSSHSSSTPVEKERVINKRREIIFFLPLDVKHTLFKMILSLFEGGGSRFSTGGGSRFLTGGGSHSSTKEEWKKFTSCSEDNFINTLSYFLDYLKVERKNFSPSGELFRVLYFNFPDEKTLSIIKYLNEKNVEIVFIDPFLDCEKEVITSFSQRSNINIFSLLLDEKFRYCFKWKPKSRSFGFVGLEGVSVSLDELMNSLFKNVRHFFTLSLIDEILLSGYFLKTELHSHLQRIKEEFFSS